MKKTLLSTCLCFSITSQISSGAACPEDGVENAGAVKTMTVVNPQKTPWKVADIVQNIIGLVNDQGDLYLGFLSKRDMIALGRTNRLIGSLAGLKGFQKSQEVDLGPLESDEYLATLYAKEYIAQFVENCKTEIDRARKALKKQEEELTSSLLAFDQASDLLKKPIILNEHHQALLKSKLQREQQLKELQSQLDRVKKRQLLVECLKQMEEKKIDNKEEKTMQDAEDKHLELEKTCQDTRGEIEKLINKFDYPVGYDINKVLHDQDYRSHFIPRFKCRVSAEQVNNIDALFKKYDENVEKNETLKVELDKAKKSITLLREKYNNTLKQLEKDNDALKQNPESIEGEIAKVERDLSTIASDIRKVDNILQESNRVSNLTKEVDESKEAIKKAEEKYKRAIEAYSVILLKNVPNESDESVDCDEISNVFPKERALISKAIQAIKVTTKIITQTEKKLKISNDSLDLYTSELAKAENKHNEANAEYEKAQEIQEDAIKKRDEHHNNFIESKVSKLKSDLDKENVTLQQCTQQLNKLEADQASLNSTLEQRLTDLRTVKSNDYDKKDKMSRRKDLDKKKENIDKEISKIEVELVKERGKHLQLSKQLVINQDSFNRKKGEALREYSNSPKEKLHQLDLERYKKDLSKVKDTLSEATSELEKRKASLVQLKQKITDNMELIEQSTKDLKTNKQLVDSAKIDIHKKLNH